MSDALINGLAGAGGGIIAQLITYPLQTVRFVIFLPIIFLEYVFFAGNDLLFVYLIFVMFVFAWTCIGKYSSTNGA